MRPQYASLNAAAAAESNECQRGTGVYRNPASKASKDAAVSVGEDSF